MIHDRIIAVDPGGETGVFVVESDGRWSWSSFKIRANFESWMADQVAYNNSTRVTVICEDWLKEGGAASNQRDAWLIIGWLDGHLRQAGVPLILQSPGDRTWTSTEKLRVALDGRLSTKNPVPNDHAKQAARHLVRWAATTPRFTYSAIVQIQERLFVWLADD